LATDGGSITARSGLVTARNVQDRSEVAVKSGGLVVESEEVLLLSEEREFEYGELLRVEVEDEEPSPDDWRVMSLGMAYTAFERALFA
jgi:hypothetical protein